MTRKITLLAGVAAGLALAAGGASAHTLTLRAAAASPAGSINAGNANVATGGYRLAEEVNFANLAAGTVALTDTLGSGSLPSGNTILTVSLTNSTFSGAVNAALVTGSGANCGTFTASLSSGGQTGGATATFVISNSTSGCAAYNLTLPVRITGQGAATVSTDLRTEAGNPIDPPNPATLTYLTTRNAFFLAVNAVVGAGALGVSQGQLSNLPANTAPYTIFRTGGQFHNAAPETTTTAQLGFVSLTADVTTFRDLQGTAVAAGDVTAAQYTATGDFSPYATTQIGAAVVNNAPGAQSAVFTSANGGLATVNAALPFLVNKGAGRPQITASPYSISLQFALAAPTFLAQPAESATLETITREGTNVVLPWINSVSIRASGGTTNIARIGNIGGAATGAVFATVLSSQAAPAGYVNQGIRQLAATIPANGELVVTTDTLTAALGDFGRGDVLITVEALPQTITLRRFLQRPGEGLTELQSGSVALDQGVSAP